MIIITLALVVLTGVVVWQAIQIKKMQDIMEYVNSHFYEKWDGTYVFNDFRCKHAHMLRRHEDEDE